MSILGKAFDLLLKQGSLENVFVQRYKLKHLVNLSSKYFITGLDRNN